MQGELSRLTEEARGVAAAVAREVDLPEARAKFLGRKGAFGQVMRMLGKLDKSSRPQAGQFINEAKQTVEGLFAEAAERLEQASIDAALQAGAIDVSLPGRRTFQGAIHPIQAVMDELIDAFMALGFDIADGPELEHERYNFDLLNMPEEHPARDMQDTFYLSGRRVLRTQTSPVQIRTMEKQKPPVRIIAPGRVFRCDSDATHSPMFHQIEGLWIDTDTTLADLKGVLTAFLHRLFGEDKPVRFRPSYFPFTEPSVEVDVWNPDRGEWMEVLGSGMVHPQVLRNVGYDPNEVQGFAFGLGVERLAMIRYGITGIDNLFRGDLRFHKQFV
ncbi:MAG: phenylalanine--tRNA ligase subunit alpha [Bradymonadia bacterium]